MTAMLYAPERSMTPTQIALAAERRQRLRRLSPSKQPSIIVAEPSKAPPDNVPPENNLSSLLDEYLKAASDLESRIAQLRQSITTGLSELQSLRGEFERLQDVKVPMVRAIAAATCDHYGLNMIDIVSVRRTPRIVFSRQVAMYLARKMTFHSLKSIGNYFGNRDHTTVKHAVEKIEVLLEANSDGGALRGDVDQIRAKIIAACA